MTTTIQDVMSVDLVACPSTATIGDAARLMRDRHIGDVIVTNGDDQLAGIVTDRDLVVRCLADGADANSHSATRARPTSCASVPTRRSRTPQS